MRRLLIVSVLLGTISLSGCLPPIDVSRAERVDGPTEPTATREAPSPAASDEPSSPSPEPEPPAAASITISGEGEASTAPFELDGDYVVDWTTGGDCYYSADLETTGDEFVFETLFSASAATSGQTFIYGYRGEFYADVITGPAPGCPWSATLTER